MVTWNQLTKKKVVRGKKKHKVRAPLLWGCPHKRATVLKVYQTKPKKPNSAQRKVAKVKLSTGKAAILAIPGQGHNLQQHSVVLVRGGRTKDLPGVKYKAIRGKGDFASKEFIDRRQRRSKFSIKDPMRAK